MWNLAATLTIIIIITQQKKELSAKTHVCALAHILSGKKNDTVDAPNKNANISSQMSFKIVCRKFKRAAPFMPRPL